MPRKSAQKTQQSWNAQMLALAVLIGLGSLTAYFVPDLSNSTGGIFSRLETVGFHQLAALALTTALTVVFLAYYRAKLLFSTRWLIAAVTYNVLILFVKFTLSTNEITNQSSKEFGSILLTAFLISLLYIFAFTVLYLFFNGKLLNKTLHKALIVSAEGKALLAMGLFICATLVRIVVFQLPILSNTTASSYLSEIFKANNALLSALLFIMVVAAVEAFAQVRRKADLKYFFVSGVVLILTFHFWWAIFVYRAY